MDRLQTYIIQVVKLGQSALALHRGGHALPDELARPAQELLALEKELALVSAAPPSSKAVTGNAPAGVAADVEGIRVLNVEEEAAGAPSDSAPPSEALPPLVVDLFDEEDAPVQRELLTPPVQNVGNQTGSPARAVDSSGICRRCGEPLRINSHYCHRCGQRHDQPL